MIVRPSTSISPGTARAEEPVAIRSRVILRKRFFFKAIRKIGTNSFGVGPNSICVTSSKSVRQSMHKNASENVWWSCPPWNSNLQSLHRAICHGATTHYLRGRTTAITESRRLIFHCQKRRLRDFGSSLGSVVIFLVGGTPPIKSTSQALFRTW